MALLTSNNKFGICDTVIEGHDIINNIPGNGAFVMYVRTGDMIYTFLSKTSFTTDTPVNTETTTTINPDIIICPNCGRESNTNNSLGECPHCGHINKDYTDTTTSPASTMTTTDYSTGTTTSPASTMTTTDYSTGTTISPASTLTSTISPATALTSTISPATALTSTISPATTLTSTPVNVLITVHYNDNEYVYEYDGSYNHNIQIDNRRFRLVFRKYIWGEELLNISHDSSLINISHEYGVDGMDGGALIINGEIYENSYMHHIYISGGPTTPTTETTTNAATTMTPIPDYNSLYFNVHYNGNEYVYNKNEDYDETSYGRLEIYNYNGENHFKLVLGRDVYNYLDNHIAYPDMSYDESLYDVEQWYSEHDIRLWILGKIGSAYGMINIYLSGGCTTMTTTDYSTDTTTSPATTLTSTPAGVSIMVHYNGNEYVYNENEYNEYGSLQMYYDMHEKNHFRLVLDEKVIYSNSAYPDISYDTPLYEVSIGHYGDGGDCRLHIHGYISSPLYGVIHHIYLSGGPTTPTTETTTSPATTLTSTPTGVSIMVHYNGNEYVYNENVNYDEYDYGYLTIRENSFYLTLGDKVYKYNDCGNYCGYPDISYEGPLYDVKPGSGDYSDPRLYIYGGISLPVYGMIHIYLSCGCTTMTTTDYSTDTTTSPVSTMTTTTIDPYIIICPNCGRESNINNALGECPYCGHINNDYTDITTSPASTITTTDYSTETTTESITTSTSSSSSTTTSKPFMVICDSCGHEYSRYALNSNDGCPRCGDWNYTEI